MNQPFSSLLMMCGGGMRFGAYLGAYAALCERGRRPDALLASCGGGFAALTVALAPQPEDARRLLCSPAMHRVLMLACASSAPRRQTLFQAAWRWYLYRSPQRLARYLAAEGFDYLADELARLALFALADGANAHNWLDPLFQAAGGIRADAPALLISAARLENENGRPRLRQLLFAPSAQAPLPAVPDCATAALSPRIAAAVEIRPLKDWQAALYATISDMYYLAPLSAPEGGVYLGGVVDLLPIEQAAALAGTVYAEHKPPYARALALPAIARVLGFDAEARRQQAAAFAAPAGRILRLPFADIRTALRGHCPSRRFNLRSGRIEPQAVPYAAFAAQMAAQWDYGYRRAQQMLEQAA
ncbi:hypothetical protein OP500_04535 [Kingella sp. SNUBH-2017]|uniref:patatin-like phospholipase family protein n=1 Tax=Kingella sp. SNUBH-2017 TaxID=2994077 RepID=UPI0023632007|nr:patatin-like phospholipase family protein [Kingella sp. SNUBH-2017]MDD2182585.1 hypothetical protein [Kingella sp. SNUBH-2017]